MRVGMCIMEGSYGSTVQHYFLLLLNCIYFYGGK